MGANVVGIDGSKGGLDVHVHPAGEAFRVDRDAAGPTARLAAGCGAGRGGGELTVMLRDNAVRGAFCPSSRGSG